MIEQFDSKARKDAFGSKINRDHSPVMLYAVPWLSILLASLTPLWPVIAPAPIVPPFAFLLLLSWRILRPDILPLWAGFPLGLWDDFFSGQPLGSAILLFSLTCIALDLIERRFPWRGFWQNWLTATLFLMLYLPASVILSGADITLYQLRLILPQMLLSVVAFPIVMRLVAVLDTIRLLRVRTIG